MSSMRWTVALSAVLLLAWSLKPGEPEAPPAAPRSILGPAPALPAEAPPIAAVPVNMRPAETPAVAVVTPGPFAPRPRPPAVMAFGAAAPLAPGQDTSAYHPNGEKPDLSD